MGKHTAAERRLVKQMEKFLEQRSREDYVFNGELPTKQRAIMKRIVRLAAIVSEEDN